MSLAPGPRSGASWWRQTAGLVHDTRRQIAVAILCAVGQAALLLPVAVLVRRVFDVEVPRHDSAGIVVSGALTVACYVASLIVAACGQAAAARAAKHALARVRRHLIATVTSLPLSWHDRHDAGELHSVIVTDCDRVDRMVYGAISQALPAMATLVALAVVALVINPVLFGAVAVFVPAMLYTTRRFARSFERRVDAFHTAARTLSSHAQRMLGGLSTIRAAGADRRDREQFDREIDTFAQTSYRAAVARSGYQALHGSIAALTGVVVLVVGGLLAAAGELTLGGLLAFYAVLALMLRQTGTAQSSGPLILEGRVALARVLAMAQAAEPDAYAGTRSIAFHGGIELSDVTFAYRDTTRPAVAAISLTVDPGEQVCLMGPSGAGKTTLMALMLGLYRPQHGQVRADGVALETLDLTGFRGQTGVILQDTVLFRGSIRENLLLGTAAAAPEEIEAAVTAAALGPVLEEMPGGLDGALGDDGAGLSGGERQRIAIARAILGRPALVLLDEPTAQLPPALATTIIDNLTRLPWRPSVLVITHDASVAAHMQRVLHLRDGRLLNPPGDKSCDERLSFHSSS